MMAYPYTVPVLVARNIQLLTAHHLAITLSATGNKPVRAWKPVFSIGVKPPQPFVAFLCASYCAALCRLFIMAGCFGKPSRLAAPMRGISTPLQPVAHAVESMNGGYSRLSIGVTA
ncbi:MAG: hypothetical protein WAW36_18785 [Methylovulum miyakonense]|uniref:hypothetical protein n=1 Tax=Methylovulum miyakonense TaxID=645578 RepID=UPI003BB577C3